jgi:phosphohistidine phosphatase
MEVILVRHGDAGSHDAARYPDDRLRPLSARGRDVHPRVMQALARAGVRFDHLLTSPLARARETADLTKHAFGWAGAIETTETLGEAFSIDGLLALLAAYPDRSHVLCVGHEPGLSHFAAAALAGAPTFEVDLRPSGVIGLSWREWPRLGAAMLRYVVRPEHLAAI